MAERIVDLGTVDLRAFAGEVDRQGAASSGLQPAPVHPGLAPIKLRHPGEDRCIFQISFDPSSGLVRAYAAGAWTSEETRRYLAGLDIFVKRSRSMLGKARVLLDRREVSVQSPEVAALLATANGEIFEADDRIAIVVTTSMIKVDLRRRMPHPGSKAFLSIDAAATWLSAFEGRL